MNSLEKNQQLAYQSAVTGLQMAYIEYMKAVRKWYQNTGVNSDGRFYMLDGYEDMAKHIQNRADDVKRLSVDVEYYRQFVRGDKE